MSRKYRVFREGTYDNEVCDTDNQSYALTIARLLDIENPADAPHWVARVEEYFTEVTQ